MVNRSVGGTAGGDGLSLPEVGQGLSGRRRLSVLSCDGWRLRPWHHAGPSCIEG